MPLRIISTGRAKIELQKANTLVTTSTVSIYLMVILRATLIGGGRSEVSSSKAGISSRYRKKTSLLVFVSWRVTT
jgi:hypothetical protein